jgi:hypothetical protein
MKLWLESLDLVDCLQPENSQFGIAASSHEKVMGFNSTIQSSTLSPTTNTARKMVWPDCGSESRNGTRFSPSGILVGRLNNSSEECSFSLWKEEPTKSLPGLIEVSCKFTGDAVQEYEVRFRSFAVQWNPSTVIAVQRFLGRLRKESKTIAGQVFHRKIDDLLGGSKSEEVTMPSDDPPGKPGSEVKAKIYVDSLTICLNKEHQYRRLLELTFSSCEVHLNSSEHGMLIDAKLADLASFDMDGYFQNTDEIVSKENRKVISVLSETNVENSGQFLHVVYQTFNDHAKYVSATDVPDWVLSHLTSRNDIDDFLSLKMASTRFTYLKDRTEELLDYLSNGLPGKGMGATSRAAKGFISRRIQTKSFLQIQVDSPQVYIPQHGTAKRGLALKLGMYNPAAHQFATIEMLTIFLFNIFHQQVTSLSRVGSNKLSPLRSRQ